MKPNKKLQLISTSPQRAALLRSAKISFEIRPPFSDEKRHVDETSIAYVVRTAHEKAESVPLQPGVILLGADTIVVLENQIFGKPADPKEAVTMLRKLSGKMHEVITGVCLRSCEKTICFHVATSVLFRDLSEADISAYVATGDSLDRAGSYAIQGGAAGMVRRIDGSYSNVVGLPLCEVIEALETF